MHINSHLFLFENDFAEEELQALISIVDTELLKAVERQALDNTYQDDMEIYAINNGTSAHLNGKYYFVYLKGSKFQKTKTCTLNLKGNKCVKNVFVCVFGSVTVYLKPVYIQ